MYIMLHAIERLLDSSAHIDSYVAYITVARGMARCLYCKQYMPSPEKGSAMQD